MKVRSVSCPYCKIEMKYRGVNYENLAKTMLATECTVPYMIYVEYYECPQCGKIELFHDRRNMKSRDDDQPEAAAHAAEKPAEAPAEEQAPEKKTAAKKTGTAKKTASEKKPAAAKKTGTAKKTASSKTASEETAASKKKKSDKE